MKPQGNGIGILGMGAYLPEEVRTNDWWPKEYVEEHLRCLEEDVLTSGSFAAAQGAKNVDDAVRALGKDLLTDPFRGIRERRVLANDMEISEMESRACLRALESAGVEPSEIDCIIGYSLPQEFAMPGNEMKVARQIGLAESTRCMAVDGACASFCVHMEVASALVQSGSTRKVLCFQSFTGSHLADYRRPSSVVMGDGAVATVVGHVAQGEGFVAHQMRAFPEQFEALVVKPGISTEPFYRGDRHSEGLHFVTLNVDKVAQVSSQPVRFCQELCESLMEQNDVGRENVGLFLTSQPTVWFPEACCESLGISTTKTLTTFSWAGHLMGASAPLNLCAKFLEESPQEDTYMIVYAPGAGLRTAAMLYHWSGPPNFTPIL